MLKLLKLSWLLSIIIGIWLWPFSINSWLLFLNKEPIVQWWHGAILGAFPIFGDFCIPIAIITWLLF